MKNRIMLSLLVAISLLASCGDPDFMPSSSLEEFSLIEGPSSETQSSDTSPSDSSSYDPVYPFYSDADFLQKAYAMGYSDRLLTRCWDNGHTKESLLYPPVSFLYDVSPDGNWSLYQGSTPDGGMLLRCELVCLKNNSTGEIIVLGAELAAQRGMMYANICFCPNDAVSILDSYGGVVYSLTGDEILSVTLDPPEASGYYIYGPVYNPVTQHIVGLGTDYKTGNSVNYETDKNLSRTFVLIECDTSGKVVNTALTDIPMEVNKNHSIITPSAAYVRDGYVWIAMTTNDGRYPFYRMDITDTYDTELVDSDVFRAVFPTYDKKG
jgi:hypothetical protein